MKKAGSLLIAVLLLLMFTACGDSVVGTWELCGSVGSVGEQFTTMLEDGVSVLLIVEENGDVYIMVERDPGTKTFVGKYDANTNTVINQSGDTLSCEIKNGRLYLDEHSSSYDFSPGEHKLIFQKR
jgi:hypothetical protein